jgi:hypothetical protein
MSAPDFRRGSFMHWFQRRILLAGFTSCQAIKLMAHESAHSAQEENAFYLKLPPRRPLSGVDSVDRVSSSIRMVRLPTWLIDLIAVPSSPRQCRRGHHRKCPKIPGSTGLYATKLKPFARMHALESPRYFSLMTFSVTGQRRLMSNAL